MGDVGEYVGGVFLAMATACVNSLGMGLQKRTHLDFVGVPVRERRYWLDRRWQAGVACLGTASVLVLVNYALLGQSITAALSSLTIVTNAVMAHFYLRESFTGVDAGATALIIAGVVLAVVSAASDGSAPRASLDLLLAALSREGVYIAAALIAGLICTLEFVIARSDRKNAALLSAAANPAAVAASAAFAVALGADDASQEEADTAPLHVAALDELSFPPGRSSLDLQLECFARALLAGIYSGATGFFAKGCVVSVEGAFRAHSVTALGHGECALFFVGLPFSIFSQIRALNGGLRAFDAVIIVPLYQAAVVVCGVSFGMLFFAEGAGLAPEHVALFGLGCAISVGGIVLLTCKGGLRSGDGVPDALDVPDTVIVCEGVGVGEEVAVALVVGLAPTTVAVGVIGSVDVTVVLGVGAGDVVGVLLAMKAVDGDGVLLALAAAAVGVVLALAMGVVLGVGVLLALAGGDVLGVSVPVAAAVGVVLALAGGDVLGVSVPVAVCACAPTTRLSKRSRGVIPLPRHLLVPAIV